MGLNNREPEQKQLLKWSQQAAEGQSSLTLMVGRRRVGKTALLHQTYQNQPSLYLLFLVSPNHYYVKSSLIKSARS